MGGATGKTDGSHRSKLIKGFIDKRTRLNKLNFALGICFGVKISHLEVLALSIDVQEGKISLRSTLSKPRQERGFG